MKLILLTDMEELETFLLDEVFRVTDEGKWGWIIVVDISQFEGQPEWWYYFKDYMKISVVTKSS